MYLLLVELHCFPVLHKVCFSLSFDHHRPKVLGHCFWKQHRLMVCVHYSGALTACNVFVHYSGTHRLV